MKQIGKYKIEVKEVEKDWGSIRYMIIVKKGRKLIEKSIEYEYKKEAEQNIKDEILPKYLKIAGSEKNHKCSNRYSRLIAKGPNSAEMIRVCLCCGKAMESKIITSTFEGFIRAFIQNRLGKTVKCGKYSLKKGKVIYFGKGKDVGEGEDILITTLPDGRIIGNASKLDRCGSYRRGDEAPAQRVMFDMHLPMIPFNVFKETSLDISTAKVIEQGPEEDFILPKLKWSEKNAMLKPIDIYKFAYSKKKPIGNRNRKIVRISKEYGWRRKRDKKTKKIKNVYCFIDYKYKYIDNSLLTKRHFVGAMLLEVEGKQYLFDVDRNELKHYRFNPFLSELPKKVKTIEEAYELLKPEEVKKAKKFKRQGEWFFIPIKKKIKKPNYDKVIDALEKKKDKLEVIYISCPKTKKYDLNGDFFANGDPIQKSGINHYLKQVDKQYHTAIKKRIKAFMKEYKEVAKYKDKIAEIGAEIERVEGLRDAYEYGGTLQAGDNRPNNVEKMVKVSETEVYVKGKVTHSGREHEPIILRDWHKAIANTATKSFTITGNID